MLLPAAKCCPMIGRVDCLGSVPIHGPLADFAETAPNPDKRQFGTRLIRPCGAPQFLSGNPPQPVELRLNRHVCLPTSIPAG